MSDAEKNEQLLTAYFDNELSPEERAGVEVLIAENPELGALLNSWQANASALRQLPAYQLDAEFADRVLSQIENEVPAAATDLNVVVDRSSSTPARLSESQSGLFAIVGLAAMILLTLFVFPQWSDQPGSSKNQAEVIPDEPTKNASDVVPDSIPQFPIGSLPDGVSLNSSLPGRTNSQPVDPIVLADLMNRPLGAEQILWIADQSLRDLEAVFVKHSIEIVGDAAEKDLNLAPQSDNGIEVLYVVSTSDKMKRAIAELSLDSAAVKVFPLPKGSSVSGAFTVNRRDPANPPAAAQQIKPFDLSQGNGDAEEIARLDHFFGLTGNDDESRLIQFLLLIDTRESGALSDSKLPTSSPQR